MIEAMLQASGASAEDLARINSVIDAIQRMPERITSLEAKIEELNKTVQAMREE